MVDHVDGIVAPELLAIGIIHDAPHAGKRLSVDGVLVRVDLHGIDVGDAPRMTELVDDAVDGVLLERAVETVVVRARMVDGLDPVAVPAAARLAGIGLVTVHHHQIIVVGMGLADLVGRHAVVDVEGVPIHHEIVDRTQLRPVVESTVDAPEHIFGQLHDPVAPAQRIDRFAVDADLDAEGIDRLCGSAERGGHDQGQEGCSQGIHRHQFLSDSSIRASSPGV